MNNLTEGIETDIKIQQGLRILEFGSEFLIRKAYLRNCPLNRVTHDKANGIKRHSEKAQTMAELNEFLILPSSNNKIINKREENKII